MKNRKQKFRLIFSMLLIILSACSLCACGKKSDKGNSTGYYIYYVHNDNTKIESEEYKPKSESTTELIEEFLQQLNENGNRKEKRAIPEKVMVNSYNLLDGILTVDFNAQYLEMSSQEEVLMRSAVVLTLTQLESVDYVAFTINDNALSRSDGTIIGNMQATDFVDNLGSENNVFSATKFVLYYANEDGSKLKEYDTTENYYGDHSKEEFIVEKLIEGPKKKGYIRTMSDKTEIRSIMTIDNICYVNFEESFINEQSGVTAEMTIYSIVNSLSELNYVHKVQISVNGESQLKYNGLSLENAFIRNLDYIESKK